MFLRSITLIALGLSLALAASASEDLDQTLKAICNGKKADLISADQLSSLNNHLKSYVGCSVFVRRSISELDRLINDQAVNLCSQEKADQLLEYYSVFVTTEKYDYPQALRKLFVAYGLKLSLVCRKQMIELVSRDSHTVLTSEDYEQINKLTGGESALGQLLNDPRHYEDLTLPKYMIKLLKLQGKATNDEKIYIQMGPTHGKIAWLQTICERRFRPFYDKLITPLLSLSSIGFNYKTKTDEADKDLQVNKEIYQWYRIVLMCESLSNIEILETTSDNNSDDDGNQVMKVTTREEAADLVDKTKALSSQKHPEIEQLEYNLAETTDKPKIEDPILDSKDKSLTKAIKNFAEPTDQLGSKFYGKVLIFLKDRVKTKGIRVVGSLPGIDKTKQDKKRRDAPTHDLLSLIYEYTQQVRAYRGNKMDKVREKSWKWFTVFAFSVVISISIILLVCSMAPAFMGR